MGECNGDRRKLSKEDPVTTSEQDVTPVCALPFPLRRQLI